MGQNWPFLAKNIVAPLAFSCLTCLHYTRSIFHSDPSDSLLQKSPFDALFEEKNERVAFTVDTIEDILFSIT